MVGIAAKTPLTPDEVRASAKSRIEVMQVGATEVGRLTFEPGWKWSECIEPVVQTDSCQAEHLGLAIFGRIRVHEDGTRGGLSAGDGYRIAAGHDAWGLGDEPFGGVRVQGRRHVGEELTSTSHDVSVGA